MKNKDQSNFIVAFITSNILLHFYADSVRVGGNDVIYFYDGPDNLVFSAPSEQIVVSNKDSVTIEAELSDSIDDELDGFLSGFGDSCDDEDPGDEENDDRIN